MIINETFETHQLIPALNASLCWYDEPTLWMYCRTIGRVTYIHVSNVQPNSEWHNSHVNTQLQIVRPDGPTTAAVRVINICGGIYIAGVTEHERKERVNQGGSDSGASV